MSDSTSFEELSLFQADEYEHWREHWLDMPAFHSQDQHPFDSINVQFSCAEDRRAFLTLMGEDPARRRSIWFPTRTTQTHSEKTTEKIVVPPNRYPIYVISKGRADTRLTARALDALGIFYRIVIEPQEFNLYNEHIPENQIVVLPFSNLGQGGIPARNFVWEHSVELGAERHWILDDNIAAFYRLHENIRSKVVRENPFTSVEEFVDRYENIPMSGLNYRAFAPAHERNPPFRWNTRVYSCILLSNEPKYGHRWRGRYNEDTDLSIRFLKDGYCTALFNHYLCDKVRTMSMKGGNTDELYRQDREFDGRLEMAKSLQNQHPDIVQISWKWGRWQHHVDYSGFKRNKPIPKPEYQRLLDSMRKPTKPEGTNQ